MYSLMHLYGVFQQMFFTDAFVYFLNGGLLVGPHKIVLMNNSSWNIFKWNNWIYFYIKLRIFSNLS